MRLTLLCTIFLLTALAAISVRAEATGEAAQTDGGESTDEVQSNDPARQLQNLIFYPHKGEYRFNPEVTTQIYYHEVTSSGGAQQSSATASSDQITIGYAYGLTERLRLSIAENDLIDQTTTTTTTSTGAQANTDSNGLSDPSLGVSYRYAQNYKRGFFADITLELVTPVAQKQLATQAQNGNNFAGGMSATLALPAYLRRGYNELGFSPSVVHKFGSVGYGQTYDASNATSPMTQAIAVLRDRYHFSRDFFAEGGLQYNFPYSYTDRALPPGSASTTHNPDGNLFETLTFGYLEDFHTLLELTLSANSANGGTDTNATKTNQVTATIDAYMYFW